MSNLIKYPFVNLNDKKSVVIGYEKEEKFVPLQNKSRVKVIPADEVEAAKKADMNDGGRKRDNRRGRVRILGQEETTEEKAEEKKAGQSKSSQSKERDGKKDPAGFSEGVSDAELGKKVQEREKEAREKAEKIIEEARSQADFILSEAEKQVDMLRERAREEGSRQGYSEGMARAEQEAQSRWQEIEEEKRKSEQEYQQLLSDIEPRYVDILCSLIHKITGVIVTDSKDEFLHLLRSNMDELEPSKKYVVRVSPDDIIYVESHKEELLMNLGSDIVLDIQEEKSLHRNDCIIETDTQMVDCGLHTQLSNLTSALRMLI